MNAQFQLMLQQAIQAFQSGNLDRAASILKQVLQSDSKCLPALHILGLIKASQFKHFEAAELLKKAVKLNPTDGSIQYNLAQALSQCGADKESLPHHQKAVELNPTNAVAWLGFGKSQSNLGLHAEALAKYDRAIELNPSYTEAYLNKGAALKELKRYEESIVFAEKTLNLDPELAEAWSNKGIALKNLKRYQEAITQFDQAITLKPTYAEAWSNKGNALHELARYDEALIQYDKAIELNPNYAEAFSNKGSSLQELDRCEESVAHFNKAMILNLNIDWVHGELLNMEMKICGWSQLNEKRSQLIEKVRANEKVSFPFPLLSLCDDPSLHQQGAILYSKSEFPQNLALGNIVKREKQSKIKIAYFSADFKEHPVSYLTAELFELHDRNQFEVNAFSLKKSPDGDQTRLRLMKVFDNFYDVDSLSDQEIAKFARDLEIDIAIDLSGHTKDSKTGIFSYRAAPIQINYLGYPGTLGADYFDYIIADEVIIPEAKHEYYSEKIAYLPHTYMVDDRNRIPSTRIFSKAECGIPENAFVYCCFNSGNKFNEEVIHSWSNILSAVPNSVLWVSKNNDTFKKNLTSEFKRLNIDSHRIIFAERVEDIKDHLARYKLADVFLDTFPYNAHTTAMDSLKAGVPVVTLISQSFAGRVAASLLNAIGLPSLITETQSQYESLAIELAQNADRLASIKTQLAFNYSSKPLFNTPLFTRHIEKAFSVMMDRYWSNLPPEHFRVSAQDADVAN